MRGHGSSREHGVVVLLAALLGGACLLPGNAARPAGEGPKGEVRLMVEEHPQQVGQYEKLQLTVQPPREYENPFDPAEVNLTAVFHTPSGKMVRVPGFYARPYSRSRQENGDEALTPAGPGMFSVRFAWGEVGRYTYELALTDGLGARSIRSGAFRVVASKSKSYARISKQSRHHFALDSRDPYFPIGQNMAWPGGGGTYDYDEWMGRLARARGNYLRVWIVNEWNKLGLENQRPGSSSWRRDLAGTEYEGLGRYNQAAAWRIDYIIERAEQLGLKVLLCVDSFNTVARGRHGNWEQSPYNVANGGPCRRPLDFFTDPRAKQLFRQRLRYLVARWGYSTSVLAWEFWNEVDLTTGYESGAVASWHQEMARYLRSIDPWAHPITTSFASSGGDPAVDGLPELDFIQSHFYGSHDMAEALYRIARRQLEAHRKAYYTGEFGLDVSTPNTDPEGLHMHNGIWASVMSGAAGTAMSWPWDNYIDRHNLYHHYTGVAAFVADVNWPEERYRPVEVRAVRYRAGVRPEGHGDVLIEPEDESWDDTSPVNRPHSFRVRNDGAVANRELMSRLMHGLQHHPRSHNPATFSVDYPGPGRFEVRVNGVSGHGGAALVISLDGKAALTADFVDKEPDSPRTITEYDGAYGIDVPPGNHLIVVENTGTDWFFVAYRLTNYLTVPHLRVLGLGNDHSALLWVQNREHTWWHRANGISPLPVSASEILLGGFAAGEYEIEQWDTSTGAVVGRSRCRSTGGTVAVPVPVGLVTDVAYKIRPR